MNIISMALCKILESPLPMHSKYHSFAHSHNTSLYGSGHESVAVVTWFCYHLIAKPGNKTAAPSWPDPYPHWMKQNSWPDGQLKLWHSGMRLLSCLYTLHLSGSWICTIHFSTCTVDFYYRALQYSYFLTYNKDKGLCRLTQWWLIFCR